MVRMIIASAAVIAGLLAPAEITASSPVSAVQAAAQATAADAAPFIADWTMALQGPNGPATFALTVKVEKDKVVAEISSEALPLQPITDVTKADKSLVLSYAFDYQGNNVPAVVSLTPAADGKMSAQIDFAGGAYVMTGTATKKEKEK